MNKLLTFLFCLAGQPRLCRSAGSHSPVTEQLKNLEPVPIDYVETETAYVFESDFTNSRHDFGSQDSWENEFEYAHRFLISGNWYLRAGVSYDRYDFSQSGCAITRAPAKRHALVLGIDYMHGKNVGGFLQFRPGIYTEEHINSSAFDCPITLGRFWTLIGGSTLHSYRSQGLRS